MMDMTEFYQTFFDEAHELLADMEKNLLELNPHQPDQEKLNAIFRAAHSIKGGAGTFGFNILQETTHLLENLLDEARCGTLNITSEHIDLFLRTKDIMQEQLDACKHSAEPDLESFAWICEALRQIALESHHGKPLELPQRVAAEPAASGVTKIYDVLLDVAACAEQELLSEELKNLGEVLKIENQKDRLYAQLQTTATPDDISAVLCFILNPEQIAITPAVTTPERADVVKKPAQAEASARSVGAVQGAESSSIRVSVEKVDQIINLVGELIITQSMLSQLAGAFEPGQHEAINNSVIQLERNARDLQEAVMSIRMMPMEYVFSRFPRLVHDLAGKLGKKVELVQKGASAELDKSLIERIIDPLTHLVRNSLDHGIELPEVRRQKGKPESGVLTLSAEHQGGNIIIQVTDDGAGLNREKILERAKAQGLAVDDKMDDDEVWQLIFAPGFSTAETVTDVSGRGVGMDVVRRNIQAMGGRIAICSKPGEGSTINIILPLTLAILDGMSVRVGDELFVLPLNTVMESLQPSESALHRITGGGEMLQVRGEYLPLVKLGQLFNIPCTARQASAGIAVILQTAGSRYALLIDQLIGQHQVVVKNLELNYRKVAGISAATILGDGRVALILDVGALPAMYQEMAATDGFFND